MKFAAAAILSAAVASAEVVFNVSDFSADCVPHGSVCLYNFTVMQPNSMETIGVSCSASAPSNDGSLPDIKDGTCVGSSRTFTVTSSAQGWTLAVSQQVSAASVLVGSHLISTSDVSRSTVPNAEVESYTGPKSFSLED